MQILQQLDRRLDIEKWHVESRPCVAGRSGGPPTLSLINLPMISSFNEVALCQLHNGIDIDHARECVELGRYILNAECCL